ncbi:MAG: type I-E CRISPR-associated protein Cse1/CasA [Syntrophaceticus schinkii]|jgi:CRISPR system Cascade subunit CasA|nr:type I-E CRISPR-associated protein Cse1/CasA [Syntrophaceticus schinkii]
MNEREYNLLHEKWIVVMKLDGTTDEVSLLELFRSAPELRGLAGELPTQDVAMLRLLLAILHAVFGRYDLDGNFAPLASPSEALKRWKSLWDKGTFPMSIIEDYLQHYEDRFWLFHPERPFYQVAKLGKATDYTAAKLNGELSESNNKLRLFPQRTGNVKNTLPYAEAARWLLYVNSFDDTSAKPKTKGLPSPGAGWLGKLGLVTAGGDNLLETLLLNLVFLKDGEDKLWGKEKPVWEAETVKPDERTKITIPDNPSELLTLQSRRLLLKHEGNWVTGYYLLGGDFFPKENAISEQMTLWQNAAKKKTDPPEYHPKRHDPARQLWRDFSALVGQAEQGNNERRPGVIGWLSRLKADNIITRTHFRFQTAAVKYGDKDFFVDDIFSDSLSFNADLLTNLGKNWVHRIINEINATDKLVDQVRWLAHNLARATGDGDKESLKKKKNAAKEQAYFRLDAPFRQWLEGIVPERDSMEETCKQWREQARRIVRELGKELVTQSGPQAFVGRVVVDKKKKNKKQRYTSPEAYNQFLIRTSIGKS